MDITPATHCKNEEHWIGYVLRGPLKVFGRAILLDTGSTDRTVDIAIDAAHKTGGELHLIQENMENDPIRIGRCSTRLREMITTPWMLLVDGDEIWNEAGLRALKEYQIPDGKKVCMVNARNLGFKDGHLMRRDGWSADRLFGPDIRWDVRRDYPYQSYGLHNELDHGLVHYIEHPDVFFWHTRHIARSSKDADAFYRIHKADFFPYNGPYSELPANWLGPVDKDWPNPYLGVG